MAAVELRPEAAQIGELELFGPVDQRQRLVVRREIDREIGTRLVGAQPFESFKAAIDKELKGSKG